MATQQQLDAFLQARTFAVVGASTSRDKYGNKVLRCYQQHGKEVHPINPRADVVEGLKSYPDLRSVPGQVEAVSVITPPAITEKVVEEAAAAGVKHFWMQPGAESPKAIARAAELGMNVIGDGSCLLVVLGFQD